ncbi:MAG: LPS export ABC transporter ATP-binding protein [Acidobacteria bacterium]|nr:LPS export ABC transporter ATP-binding protein [Acidobacteriota bacterium]
MRQTLATEGLTKSYRGRKVVSDLSLEFNQGEIVGLLGPNGAGKTTTFHCILGLTPPDSGKILLNGTDITALPMYLRARKGIGYLPQEPSIFRRMTVRENLLAILETMNLGRQETLRRAVQILEEIGLSHLADRKARALSGGERRRVEIARALATSPSFILLDEPFSGIDPIIVGELQGLVDHLRKKGIGIVITDHNVRETLRITDRAYILAGGILIRRGTPEELAADPQVRQVYLGERFQLN